MNLFTKQKQTLQTNLPKGKGVAVGGGGRWINEEVGINTYTLPYVKQIINKDLLYSTRNSTQYSVITYMGKESEKEWIYVYPNPLAVDLKTKTILSINSNIKYKIF